MLKRLCWKLTATISLTYPVPWSSTKPNLSRHWSKSVQITPSHLEQPHWPSSFSQRLTSWRSAYPRRGVRDPLGITARHGLQRSSQRKVGTLCALCCRSLLPAFFSSCQSTTAVWYSRDNIWLQHNLLYLHICII